VTEQPESGRPGVSDRLAATEEFVVLSDRLFIFGGIPWTTVAEDPRLLAVNVAFRRQLDAIKAATILARADLGHLAVSFVRAALEDVLYLKFLGELEKGKSQKLFILLGKWDALRSLLAQRAYVGDESMRGLWYTASFLAAAEAQRAEVREALKEVQQEYRWSGDILPSAEWIAERTGHRRLYDYLHAATSRALHFSAGEVMRRGWGNPGGEVGTREIGFQNHLTEFALYQLVLLFFETWKAVDDTEAAGISIAGDIESEEVDEMVQRIGRLGRVPLVHAAEWNLRPST
jgi:hypothetical protein